jgi:hypothetical protein
MMPARTRVLTDFRGVNMEVMRSFLSVEDSAVAGMASA